jgi:hypothetical protein
MRVGTTLPEKAIVVLTRERCSQVQSLLTEGASRNRVGRTLGLDIQTVRRSANAATVEEVLAPALERESKVDAFRDYLHRRCSHQ